MWSVDQIIRKVRVSLFGEETAQYMDLSKEYVNIRDCAFIGDDQ